MPIMIDVVQEKQRISDQLAKLDAERAKLKEHHDELEVAERVLSRFGQQRSERLPRRGRAPAAEPKQPAADEQKARALGPRRWGAARPQPQLLPLGEATLRAVKAHAAGVSAEAVRNYLAREFGLQVRPNHLGMALQRHRRAGRIELRDSRWHALQ